MHGAWLALWCATMRLRDMQAYREEAEEGFELQRSEVDRGQAGARAAYARIRRKRKKTLEDFAKLEREHEDEVRRLTAALEAAQARSAEAVLAWCMGRHARLGAASVWGGLPEDVAQAVAALV